MKTSFWTHRPLAAVAATGLLLSLAGCQNLLGSQKPVDEVFEAALSTSGERMEDGSFARIHTVTVPKGHHVSATLVSDHFDTYLLAIPPDGSQQRENDDCDMTDSAKGSCLDFIAHVGGKWQFVANSYTADESGVYRMTVQSMKP